MKKYLNLSIWKRILVIVAIFIVLTILNFNVTSKISETILSAYDSYDIYGNKFYLLLLYRTIIRIIMGVLIILAFIVGYVDLKKTYKLVSLKDLIIVSLLLSFFFAIISFLPIPMSVNNVSGIWYLSLLSFLTYFLLYWVIIYFISLWKIFEKAGEKGWKSLIPFYNIFILLKITEKPDEWFFFFLIPFVNIIFACMVNFQLAKKFNKYDDFALGTAILPIIFYPILAFGKDEYQNNLKL